MKKEDQSISILGCGWLGLPLAEQLLAQGYRVKGSTTSADKIKFLKEKGIQPYLIKLNPEINPDYQPDFFDSQVLFLNIPPSRKQADVVDFYPQQIREVLNVAESSSLEKILFISSTSVYPNLNREVREEEAGGEISKSGQALMEVEQILLAQDRFQISILRFCGLFDDERNPGRFLAGKNLNTNGKDRINLIHQEDCIRIIAQFLEKEIWGETFNACADQHPEKDIFYRKATQKLGLEAPLFDADAPHAHKIISSEKLKKRLGYTFIHPDPEQAIDGIKGND